MRQAIECCSLNVIELLRQKRSEDHRGFISVFTRMIFKSDYVREYVKQLEQQHG